MPVNGSLRRVTAAASVLLLALVGCDAAAPTAPDPAVSTPTQSPEPSATGDYTMRVVTDGLANPWELTWGPDGYLWVTEKAAGRVVRVSPANGTRTTALTVPDVLATPGSQNGLLGLALDPALLTRAAEQFVYLAYTYDTASGPRAKIVRYEYDRARAQLVRPRNVLTGLPAGIDHQSGRLVLGPDHMLYYTIGDQGHNQFDSVCLPIEAQTLPTARQVQARDWSAYQGKVLRLGTDGAIPADNPVLAGVRSHVYSYGHRNAQGLVFGADRRLYASEQGPKTDDEVNLIRAGGNYGWPRVAGYRDDKAYVYGNWSASGDGVGCEALSFSDFELPASVPQLRESSFDDAAYVEPLRTFSTVDDGHDFARPECRSAFFICWPTVAPSSLDYYPAGGPMPGWGPSLLMPTLKDGAVYRIPLTRSGTEAGEPVELWRTVNRYRDVAIGADGRTFYVATDLAGLTRDADGRPTDALQHPGAILEFRYVG